MPCLKKLPFIRKGNVVAPGRDAERVRPWPVLAALLLAAACGAPPSRTESAVELQLVLTQSLEAAYSAEAERPDARPVAAVAVPVESPGDGRRIVVSAEEILLTMEWSATKMATGAERGLQLEDLTWSVHTPLRFGEAEVRLKQEEPASPILSSEYAVLGEPVRFGERGPYIAMRARWLAEPAPADAVKLDEVSAPKVGHQLRRF